MPPTPRLPCLQVLLCAAALAGCAARQPVEWRLLAKTAGDWPEPDRLAERVAQVADVPVLPGAAGVAPQWYAFTLRCDSRSACKRATMKLASQRDLFVELRRDIERHGPSSPPETYIP